MPLNDTEDTPKQSFTPCIECGRPSMPDMPSGQPMPGFCCSVPRKWGYCATWKKVWGFID